MSRSRLPALVLAVAGGADGSHAQGFQAGLKKHKELQLVATQVGGGEAVQSLQVTENVLTAHPDLAGIFAANEGGVVGATEAVRRAGLGHKIAIVGWDASPDEINSVRLGVVDALVVQNPFRMGYQGVNDALAMIRHGAQPTSVDTGAVYATRANLNAPNVKPVLFPTCGNPVSEGRSGAASH